MTGIKADTQTVFFVNPIIDHFQFLKSAPNLAPFASHCLKGNDYIIIISIQNHVQAFYCLCDPGFRSCIQRRARM